MFAQRELDQFRAHGHATQARLGIVNVLQGDDKIISATCDSEQPSDPEGFQECFPPQSHRDTEKKKTIRNCLCASVTLWWKRSCNESA
jgi:hypothetical protein